MMHNAGPDWCMACICSLAGADTALPVNAAGLPPRSMSEAAPLPVQARGGAVNISQTDRPAQGFQPYAAVQAAQAAGTAKALTNPQPQQLGPDPRNDS